MKILLNTFS